MNKCLISGRSLSAHDFLHLLAQSIPGAANLTDADAGPLYREQFKTLLDQMKKSSDANSALPTATGNIAALKLETVNGTFAITQRLRARILCLHWRTKDKQGSSTSDQLSELCSARVDVVRAPTGRFEALVERADKENLAVARHEDAWLARIISTIKDSPFGDHYAPTAGAPEALMARQLHDLNPRQRSRVPDFIEDPHERYMAQSRMDNSPYFDWADVVLAWTHDLKDTRTPSGLVTSQTWSSDHDQWFRTPNPGANPNAMFPGPWIDTVANPDFKPQ